MIRIIFFALIFFSCFFTSYGEKVATLEQLANPRYLIVDSGQLIISDYPYIYLCPVDDFSSIKRLGGNGEGPGEFYIPLENKNLKERGLVISAAPGRIAASSVGRISYFNRKGEFLHFTKVQEGINSKFVFLGEKVLGFIPDIKNGILSVSVFEPKLEKGNKVLDCDYWFNFSSNKMYNFFDRAADTLLVASTCGKIFLTRGDSPNFEVNAFDCNGAKLFTIRRNLQKIRIPGSFIQRIHRHFRVKFGGEGGDYYIKELNLPEHFPAVRALCAADGKLYAVTFKKVDGKSKVLVFTSRGEQLKDVYLPLQDENPERLYPFSISQNTLYQIVENEATENFELMVTRFK